MKQANAQLIARLVTEDNYGYAELSELSEDIDEWIKLNWRHRK